MWEARGAVTALQQLQLLVQRKTVAVRESLLLSCPHGIMGQNINSSGTLNWLPRTKQDLATPLRLYLKEGTAFRVSPPLSHSGKGLFSAGPSSVSVRRRLLLTQYSCAYISEGCLQSERCCTVFATLSRAPLSRSFQQAASDSRTRPRSRWNNGFIT